MEKNSYNLKKILKEIGITQKDFAEQYYSYSIGEREIVDVESDKNYSKFRKELNRNNKQNLEKYFSFLSNLDKFKKSKYTYENFLYNDILSESLIKEIKNCIRNNSNIE